MAREQLGQITSMVKDIPVGDEVAHTAVSNTLSNIKDMFKVATIQLSSERDKQEPAGKTE